MRAFHLKTLAIMLTRFPFPTIVLLLLAAAAGLPDASSAQTGDKGPVSASIIVERPRPGRSFVAAIRFSIENGWHLYWINPGDSGLPLEVTWILPDSFRAGAVEFPTPRKFESGGIIGFGYEQEVVVLCRLTPPEGFDLSRPFSVSADLDWLICKESCIPGSAKVSVEVFAGAEEGNFLNERALTLLRARMPRASLPAPGLELRSSSWDIRGSTRLVTLTFSGSLAERISDFFPEPVADHTIDHRKITVSGGTVTIPLTPAQPTVGLKEVRGIVVIDGVGYLCSAVTARK